MTPLERLGESAEFGFTLLELLGLNGWEIVRTTSFAGAGVDENGQPIETDHAAVLVIASKNGYEVRRTGESLAAVACQVFAEAARMNRILPSDAPSIAAGRIGLEREGWDSPADSAAGVDVQLKLASTP